MVRFVSGMNLERRKRNRQLTVDYLSAATGGPALYLGQDMKTAHAGSRSPLLNGRSRWITSNARSAN